MRHVALTSQTDFEGWRTAARAMALCDIPPSDVIWTINDGEAELFAAAQPLPDAIQATFSVPTAFMDLARSAILHRDPQRFALIYHLLWRLRLKPDLVDNPADPDVMRVRQLSKAVHRDQHKMKAFVRFREVHHDDHARFVAWFEPAHHIVEATAPFFERRFAGMAWSILTPDLCAHWDGQQTTFTAGACKSDAPAGDPLEDIWRSYYASIFNSARLKVKAMKTEMPTKYWRNLPEAELITPMIKSAERMTRTMVLSPPAQPSMSPQRRERSVSSAGADAIEPLEDLRAEAAACRACPLWKDATQTVFGEGPRHAPLMLVGEQPGDKEDLAGRAVRRPCGSSS